MESNPLFLNPESLGLFLGYFGEETRYLFRCVSKDLVVRGITGPLRVSEREIVIPPFQIQNEKDGEVRISPPFRIGFADRRAECPRWESGSLHLRYQLFTIELTPQPEG
jgi:hypothetical protein